jgi:hypothetical protein
VFPDTLTNRERALIQRLHNAERRAERAEEIAASLKAALDDARQANRRAAQGGLSFSTAQGGELGLCETIEPLPTRCSWWKRDGFTAALAVVGTCAGVGLLVKLLTSL